MEILASRFLLHPNDYDRSVAFYRDTLGLHPMREFGKGGGMLEITGRSDAPPGPSTELWLQVRDVGALERSLVAAQVPIVESAVRKPWGLLELRAQDPDGLVLVFVEIPPDHPLRRDPRSLPETE